MNLLKAVIPACLLLAVSAASALAQQTIVSPTNGEQVSSPFTLNMWANSFSGLPVSAVGYSLDSSSNTSSWPTWYIDGPVAALFVLDEVALRDAGPLRLAWLYRRRLPTT